MTFWVSLAVLGAVYVAARAKAGPRAATGLTVIASVLVPVWVTYEVAGVEVTARVAAAGLAVVLCLLETRGRPGLRFTPLDGAAGVLFAVHLAADAKAGDLAAAAVRAAGEWAVPYLAGRLALVFAAGRGLIRGAAVVAAVLGVAAVVELATGLGEPEGGYNVFRAVFGWRPLEDVRPIETRWMKIVAGAGPTAHALDLGLTGLLLFPFALAASAHRRRGVGTDRGTAGAAAGWLFRWVPAFVGGVGVLATLWPAVIVAFWGSAAAAAAVAGRRRLIAAGAIAVPALLLVAAVPGRVAGVVVPEREVRPGRVVLGSLDAVPVAVTPALAPALVPRAYVNAVRGGGVLGYGTGRVAALPPDVPMREDHAATASAAVVATGDPGGTLLTTLLRCGPLGPVALACLGIFAAGGWWSLANRVGPPPRVLHVPGMAFPWEGRSAGRRAGRLAATAAGVTAVFTAVLAVCAVPPSVLFWWVFLCGMAAGGLTTVGTDPDFPEEEAHPDEIPPPAYWTNTGLVAAALLAVGLVGLRLGSGMYDYSTRLAAAERKRLGLDGPAVVLSDEQEEAILARMGPNFLASLPAADHEVQALWERSGGRTAALMPADQVFEQGSFAPMPLPGDSRYRNRRPPSRMRLHAFSVGLRVDPARVGSLPTLSRGKILDYLAEHFLSLQAVFERDANGRPVLSGRVAAVTGEYDSPGLSRRFEGTVAASARQVRAVGIVPIPADEETPPPDAAAADDRAATVEALLAEAEARRAAEAAPDARPTDAETTDAETTDAETTDAGPGNAAGGEATDDGEPADLPAADEPDLTDLPPAVAASLLDGGDAGGRILVLASRFELLDSTGLRSAGTPVYEYIFIMARPVAGSDAGDAGAVDLAVFVTSANRQMLHVIGRRRAPRSVTACDVQAQVAFTKFAAGGLVPEEAQATDYTVRGRRRFPVEQLRRYSAGQGWGDVWQHLELLLPAIEDRKLGRGEMDL